MRRAELASQLWGAAFIFLVAYACLVVWLSGAHVRRLFEAGRARSALLLEGGGELCGGYRPGSEIGYRVESSLPSLPPACRYRWESELRASGGRRWRFTAHPRPGSSVIEGRSLVPGRGLYRGPACGLWVEDVFGFFMAPVRSGGEDERLVYPSGVVNSSAEVRSREGGQTLRMERVERRTEELHEVRAYLPGDDPRRIHWKLLAHRGSLMVRLGEQQPPPDSDVLVLVDTALAEAVVRRPERALAWMDAIAARVAGIAGELIRAGGCNVLLAARGAGLSDTRGEEERALAFAAGLAPSSEAFSDEVLARAWCVLVRPSGAAPPADALGRPLVVDVEEPCRP